MYRTVFQIMADNPTLVPVFNIGHYFIKLGTVNLFKAVQRSGGWEVIYLGECYNDFTANLE